LRVEDCKLVDNGLDGMDATQIDHLVVRCTITGNGWDHEQGVGIRIGRGVSAVTLTDNVVEENRFADVYYADDGPKE